MKGIIGKIRGATDRSVVIGIAVIVLLVIIFGVIRFTGSNDNVAVGDDNNVEDFEITFDDDTDTSDTNGNTALVSDSVNDFIRPAGDLMIVNVPVLAGELFDTDKGDVKQRGCDNIIFIQREVPKSPAVLNATLIAMFNMQEDLGFLPGNFVANRDNLEFNNAVIENGVAKIYLEGEVGTLAGVCDEPRLQIQVEEAALQFSTVNSVEIYLNGEMI